MFLHLAGGPDPGRMNEVLKTLALPPERSLITI